jgi:serine/threonine protein kinase
MSPCLDYNDFAALLDGSLSNSERQEALSHLCLCLDCRAVAMDLGCEVSAAGALPEPASKGLSRALVDTAVAADEGPSPLHAEAEPLLGRMLGGYRIQCEIGRGGMGAVYEVVHERMGQRAALKVLNRRHANDADFIRRFRSEARAASMVRHPGLVTIFNHGQFPDGTPYILMEYLEGTSLRTRIEERRLPVSQVLRIGRQVASALCSVHQHGIVHRDLKPENILIIPDADLPSGERTKVVDFGIAKLDSEQTSWMSSSAAGPQTEPRVFLGTAAYASPEQCRMSRSIDGKSDVYSLGVILYEALGGDLPFSGTVTDVLGLHVSGAPPSLHSLAPQTPRAVASLVHDMLAKSPQQRPSMPEVRDRLDQLMASVRTEESRSPVRLSTGVLLLGGAVALVLHLLGIL